MGLGLGMCVCVCVCFGGVPLSAAYPSPSFVDLHLCWGGDQWEMLAPVLVGTVLGWGSLCPKSCSSSS